MTNTRTLKPVAYFKATEKHGILWGEDCCCADPVYSDYEDHEGEEVVNLAVYPAAAYEALQKELNQVKEESQKSILNLRTAMDLQIKRDDQTLREANAVHIGQWRQLWDEKEQLENTLVIQAKRIAELENDLVEWNEFKKIRDMQMQALRKQIP